MESMLSVLAVAVNDRSAVYVSSPLTTGRRYSDWLREIQGAAGTLLEHREDLRRLVIEPNRAAANEFAQRLRRRLGGIVIDPTALPEIADWGQDEYRHFCGRMIEEYVGTVVFMEGWNYSSGCAYEFFVSVTGGVTALDHELRNLSRSEGRALIGTALRELRDSGLPAEFLQRIWTSLQAAETL